MSNSDHAGIATQMLVEKQLKTEGVDKHGLGREGFLERVWQWKEQKGGRIVEQMQALGASADWSRLAFTMDTRLSAAVTDAFSLLHLRGLVYRGEYLVNWSTSLQTAVSDLEVEYSEEKGCIFYFRYPVPGAGVGGEDAYLAVATTRPETLFGDTAICVNPADERYGKLVGKQARVPFTDRLIPSKSRNTELCHVYLIVFIMTFSLSPFCFPYYSSCGRVCGSGVRHRRG